MRMNEIGVTGVRIPPIIFGTSSLGNLYTALSDDTKLELVRQAFEAVPSPVAFDCAGKYGAGLALEKLGECLEKLHVNPDNVVISNKLGWKQTALLSTEPTFEPGVWMNLKNDATQDISYDGIMACYQQGNLLLGTQYSPQLVSVHDPDEYLLSATSMKERDSRFMQIIDAYNALSDLKKEGKVKALGIGAKNWQVIQEITQEVNLDWVMFANSMTIMHHPAELLEFMQQLHNNRISIINSAVFHAGFLIGGKFFDYKLIQPDTAANKRIFKWRSDFFDLCNKHRVSPAVACISFATSIPGVISIALNTSNPNNIKENVNSVMTRVSDEFWADMKAMKLIDSAYPFV